MGTILLVLTLAIIIPEALIAGAQRVGPSEVELVSENRAIVPGQSFELGLRIFPDSNWHVYWKNPGDAGLPPKLKWLMPEGFKVSEINYSAPSLIPAGPLAAYGYYGEAAPDFTLMDANGKKHSLSDYKDKFVVLEWVNYDCPFVKKHYHSGNMQKIQSTYTEKEVVWLSICSSAPGNQGHYTGKDLVAAIAKEKSNATAYLIDESGEVGKLYKAKTTPNMYIVNPEGILIYAGAIDDTPSYKQDDIPNSVNYVVNALQASMAGKKVEVKATQPYGCSVKYSKK